MLSKNIELARKQMRMKRETRRSAFGGTLTMLGVILLGTLVRMWLAEGMPLLAIPKHMHDDRLYVTLAKNIFEGHWLGTYNVFTLIKGPFFPIWIALMKFLGIPLLLGVNILYAASCLMLVQALRTIINNKTFSVLLYLVLLYNPAGFDVELTRATREMLYLSLTLMVVACALGIYLHSWDTSRSWLWEIRMGISFGCFWLTREEGIWIFPFLLIIIIARLFIYINIRNWSLARSWLAVKVWIVPLLIWLLMWNVVNLINYRYYGVYAKTEMDAHSFKAAYGALTRVVPPKIIRYVPVTRLARQKIYDISPSFRELADYFEGPSGLIVWSEMGIRAGTEKTKENRMEILGGWFMWSFRDAVATAGYYNNGRYPEEYYARLADEINIACATGQLECLPERTTLAPVLYWYHAKYMPASMLERFAELVQFKSISVTPGTSQGSEEDLLLFHDMTSEKIYNPDMPTSDFSYSLSDPWNSARISILTAILAFYRFLSPLLTGMALFAFAWILFAPVSRGEFFRPTVVIGSFLVLILTRITLLSLIDAASYDLTPISYLYPLHPLFLAFISLTLFYGIRVLRQKYLPDGRELRG